MRVKSYGTYKKASRIPMTARPATGKTVNAVAEIPEGKLACPVCSTVVLIRKDGRLRAHDYCRGAWEPITTPA